MTLPALSRPHLNPLDTEREAIGQHDLRAKTLSGTLKSGKMKRSGGASNAPEHGADWAARGEFMPPASPHQHRLTGETVKLSKRQQDAQRQLREFLETVTEEEKQILFAEIRRKEGEKKASRNLGRRIARKARQIGKGCQCCGYHHWAVLHIHHINPVHEMGYADERLMWSLCPNCHAYVHELRRARGKKRYDDIFTTLVVLYAPEAVKSIEFLANFQSRYELAKEGERREFTTQYTDEHYELYYSTRPYNEDD